MRLRVRESVLVELARLAKERGRRPEEMLEDAIRRYVERERRRAAGEARERPTVN